MKIGCVACIWMLLTEIRFSSTDGIKAHGYTGQNITVSCNHNWAWSNRKYFCRDPCAHDDVLVSSDRSPNGKFSLKDFRNGTFTVTITDPQESDSGIYSCAVDRVGFDTYQKINLNIFKAPYTHKDISPTTTTLYTTQPLPTTQQPETQFATSSSTSSSTSRSSTLEYTTSSPSATGLVNISLYSVGGVTAVIIFVCGLVAVCQHKNKVRASAGLVSATPVNHNEGKFEEDNKIYENDLQDTPKSKSKQIKSKVQMSESHSVYENVELSTGQSDVIYGNLSSKHQDKSKEIYIFYFDITSKIFN